MKFGVRQEAMPIRMYDYETICGAVDESIYPEEFEIERCAVVKDQKDISACAAFAYATILEHIFEQRMSEPFIYSMLRGDADNHPGMYVTRLLDLAVKIGAVPLSSFGILLEMPEVRELVKKFPELVEIAKQFRIKSYASINYANEEKRHNAIRNALKCNVTKDGKNIPLLAVSNYYFGECHAIVLRGWNDKNKTYKIQNSWGEEWGDGGYDEVPRSAIDAVYVIYPEEITLPFADVSNKDWFFKDVKNMFFTGLIKGTTDTTFEPERAITRAEACAMFNRHSKRDDEENERIWRAINELKDLLKG